MLAYGPMHDTYASGREGDWFKIGVANNARYISLDACAAAENGYVAERYKEKLADLDEKLLVALIKETAKTGFAM